MRSHEWLAHYQSLRSATFTVVDLETTGVRSTADRVIEVSILHGTLGEGILGQETHLINPGVTIPAKITRFTGITPAMVQSARSGLSVWTQCLPLLSTGILTAHNLAFDYKFLQKEYQRLGIAFSRPPQQQLCTVLLSRLLLSDLPSRSLPNLIKHFGFPIATSHRAAPDTLACWLLVQELFQRLLDLQEEAKILRLLGDQWISEQEAAAILHCTPDKIKTLVAQTTVKQRYSHSRRAMVYLRKDIESLTYE